jgi:hypothetical protein
MVRPLLLLAFALSFVACGGTAEPGVTVVATRGTVMNDPVLEGGWWYIQADSGEKYTPLPLPDEFKVPGLRVQASLEMLKGQGGFLPGPYVRILSIEKLAVAEGGP